MAESDFPDQSGPLWRSLLTRLEYFNVTYNHLDGKGPIDDEVDRILAECRAAVMPNLEDLYVAEKRLMRLLPPEVLDADAMRKFEIAARKNLYSVTMLSGQYESAKTDAAKRAIHFELTDALQYFFVTRIVTRNAQRRANERLNRLAWFLVMPTFVLLALLYIAPNVAYLIDQWMAANDGEQSIGLTRSNIHDFLSRYHLFAVMWFGLLGAYFSRLISFQQNSDSMTRDTLTTDFSYSAILLRLVVGLMGAIIMYLILKAEMIGGTLFPDWEAFQFVDAPTELAEVSRDDLRAPAEGTEGLVGGGAMAIGEDGSIFTGEKAPDEATVVELEPQKKESIRLISKTFAQLLVWSLLAGFSERLIPDRFRSIERDSFGPNGSGA